MKPWQSNDLAKILATHVYMLRLVNEETIETVANAVFANPKLGALATNAGMAYCLAIVLSRLSARCSRMSWDRQLEEWTPTLVTRVVESYMSDNCFRDLPLKQRRRVVAAIFRALNEMKQGDATMPTFLALEHREIPAADALVQYNLEWGTNDKTEIVSGEEFPLTVTPAMTMVLYSMVGAMVLYSMVGVPTTVQFVPGWRGEVEVAALYALRQTILQLMERYASDLSTGKGFPKALDESLEKVRLLKLDHALQGNTDNTVVSIPMVDAETVMINVDAHSFVDVIAPYTLITCKFKQPSTTDSSSPVHVNLGQELEKCGLNRKSKDTRLLRGLLALWQGKLDMKARGIPQDSNRCGSSSTSHPQLAKSFPETYFSRVPRQETLHYAVIQGNPSSTCTVSLDKDKTLIPLPKLLDRTTPGSRSIDFIVSTNADTLQVQVPVENSMHTLTITPANLNENMQIDVGTLTDDWDRAAWTSFVTDKILKRVEIKFLFTL